MIKFKFEGKKYTAPSEFYERGAVLLPDGRMLVADGFLESNPPRPAGLRAVEDSEPLTGGFVRAVEDCE